MKKKLPRKMREKKKLIETLKGRIMLCDALIMKIEQVKDFQNLTEYKNLVSARFEIQTELQEAIK